jgi:hypothetical protein
MLAALLRIGALASLLHAAVAGLCVLPANFILWFLRSRQAGATGFRQAGT